FVAVAIAWTAQSAVARQKPFLGRWALKTTAVPPAYVGWLEVREEGGQLAARFSNRGGSPTPVASIQVVDGELVFQPAAGRRGPSPEYHVRAQGERLTGTTTAGEQGVGFV